MTSPALEVPGPRLAGGHLQGGEEWGLAVAFVVMAVASERLAGGKPEPALGPFQGLDVRLLVHAQEERVFRRIQIKAHDVGGLRCEFRIGAHAPNSPPAQMNLMFPQDTPDMVGRNVAQMLREQTAGPRGVALWRRIVPRGKGSTFPVRGRA